MKKNHLDKILDRISSIFQDELIFEVCALYGQLVLDRELSESTRAHLLSEYQELFNDRLHGGHFTWVALAYLQFELGIQDNQIKENALSTIENELIFPPSNSILSKQKLIKIKDKLLSPPHKEIPLEKPQYFYSKWKVGDVFSVKLDSEEYIDFNLQGRYVLFVNVGDHITFPKNICPKIVCLNWHGDTPMFDLSKIRDLDVLPTFFFNQYRNYKILVVVDDEESLIKSNLIYIGNISELSFLECVAKDIDDIWRKNFLSVELLKSGMIPIIQFRKKNIMINPDGHHII